ncbi:MAG: hypothetical protein IJG70_05875 [Kiritimatiellae bacterium]|nr:hypothetical protein [Kiritimatiellia bacterium]
MPKKSSGLTPAQRSAFFRALQAASIELGHATPAAREAYRREVMREETGKEHLAQLSRTKDFDACMRRFAADAGDYEAASRFAIADDARKAALVRICCAQVMQLKGCTAGTTEAADYLAGIVEQARVPCGRDIHDSSFWMDCAPGSLQTLFQILDTHRRRLLRGILDPRTARTFIKFDPGIVYQPLPDGGLRIKYVPRAYSSLETVRVNVRGVA